MHILVDEFAAVDFLAVVGAVDANGRRHRSAVHNDGSRVASSRRGGDLYGATAYRYIFAFEAFAGLDRLEMSHLFGDFGTDLLHLLVNEVAQCGGNGSNDQKDAEENHPHAPIALAGLLAEHVSAIAFVAVFEHQFVPLTGKKGRIVQRVGKFSRQIKDTPPV